MPDMLAGGYGLLYHAQASILPGMWFMTHHLESTISTRKFAWKTLSACLPALSFRQRIWTHHSGMTTSRLAWHDDRVAAALGKSHTWTLRGRPARWAGSAKPASGTRAFLILQSWETAYSYVTMFGFMIWVYIGWCSSCSFTRDQ